MQSCTAFETFRQYQNDLKTHCLSFTLITSKMMVGIWFYILWSCSLFCSHFWLIPNSHLETVIIAVAVSNEPSGTYIGFHKSIKIQCPQLTLNDAKTNATIISNNFDFESQDCLSEPVIDSTCLRELTKTNSLTLRAGTGWLQYVHIHIVLLT